ncbi:hypothetical protein ASPWEDRAFT_167476 [Aspergillus wentii DTO 134E9]|uniref:Integral membrane protein n=1 Tax=Aspergillus wentii DTO 134E9 TaxID=1073089 RepID=A0A1L9S2S5_ASPWE|nr:uncharacterized protein ASPWEDRAFT_167476 [Aspergillus wentii DTO 134E9]KAI9929807.1 hypothetical protein MW887_011612 [Aspergillus wentii]OJJ41462.1 hypothetical protein ASPWEDRAFT_167476 [Aspergillus wentii DTO 134E9]
MDRIEPADGSDDPRGTTPFPPAPENDNCPEITSTRSTSYQQRQQPLLRSRRPSIRIQRLSSIPSLNNIRESPAETPRSNGENIGRRQNDTSTSPSEDDEAWAGNRRRSSSEPRPGRWSSPAYPIPMSRIATRTRSRSGMHPLAEESSNLSPIASEPRRPTLDQPRPELSKQGSRNLLRRTSEAAINRISRNRASTITGASPPQATRPGITDRSHTEYDPHIVDVLDVIDPEVSALSTLTNVQNSLFVPNLGGFLNRNPTYTLTPPREAATEEETTTDENEEPAEEPKPHTGLERLHHFTSLSSVLHDPRFAVLPDGSNLDGWTIADVEELNDHVRHMLHSRRSKFKRAMRGFGQYVSKPLGFLITLYATLITLFGLAWVLFLIGWINVGGKQLYVINVIDNVLVALFAIMGDGLAPFRAIDTYHMIFIAHYTFLTWKIRRKRDLPKLKNKNDLPSRREMDVDVEFGDTPKDEEHEFSVLNRLQQLRLMHHQNKLSRSHTFYKPHETVTHHAFPLRMLVAIVVILDCHSLLQIALGACTWSIDYHVRPFALTTVILCCSICCNITGGVLIMIGDRRSRKKDVVERMFRQQLTEEAIKKMEKRKRKEERRNNSLDQTLSPTPLVERLKPVHGA